MSVTYNKPLTERLLCLYHKDYKDLLTVDLFSVYLLPHVDCNSLYRGRFYVWASGLCSLYRRIRYIEVRYIEVLFHTFYCNFGPDIEYSSLYRGLRQLNRGSLNRGATVLSSHRFGRFGTYVEATSLSDRKQGHVTVTVSLSLVRFF